MTAIALVAFVLAQGEPGTAPSSPAPDTVPSPAPTPAPQPPPPPTPTSIPAPGVNLVGGPAVNLLVGLPPPKVDRVQNANRMTDGQAAEPGDGWQTFLTSVIEKDGSVTWDFGATRDFHGAWVQGDNNDVYVLSTSEDGQIFTPVWESSIIDNAGMQTRTSTTAVGRGRYLKLTAKGGDGSYSVGEIAVFADPAEVTRYAPKFVRTAADPPPCDGNWLVIALVLAGVVFLVRRMKPREAKADPKPVEPKSDGPPPPAA